MRLGGDSELGTRLSGHSELGAAALTNAVWWDALVFSFVCSTIINTEADKV